MLAKSIKDIQNSEYYDKETDLQRKKIWIYY